MKSLTQAQAQTVTSIIKPSSRTPIELQLR
jgi:hypothetical protein